jgi:hypothetical protein
LPDQLLVKRDSLLQQLPKKDTIYPFNPNRLSAWQAYQLDLPKSLADTIRSRVAQQLYFQTAQEFKKFAQIPEEKWQKIEPLILFPKWQIERNPTRPKKTQKTTQYCHSAGAGSSLWNRTRIGLQNLIISTGTQWLFGERPVK